MDLSPLPQPPLHQLTNPFFRHLRQNPHHNQLQYLIGNMPIQIPITPHIQQLTLYFPQHFFLRPCAKEA